MPWLIREGLMKKPLCRMSLKELMDYLKSVEAEGSPVSEPPLHVPPIRIIPDSPRRMPALDSQVVHRIIVGDKHASVNLN
jgi:hypothetical protein